MRNKSIRQGYNSVSHSSRYRSDRCLVPITIDRRNSQSKINQIFRIEPETTRQRNFHPLRLRLLVIETGNWIPAPHRCHGKYAIAIEKGSGKSHKDRLSAGPLKKQPNSKRISICLNNHSICALWAEPSSFSVNVGDATLNRTVIRTLMQKQISHHTGPVKSISERLLYVRTAIEKSTRNQPYLGQRRICFKALQAVCRRGFPFRWPCLPATKATYLAIWFHRFRRFGFICGKLSAGLCVTRGQPGTETRIRTHMHTKLCKNIEANRVISLDGNRFRAKRKDCAIAEGGWNFEVKNWVGLWIHFRRVRRCRHWGNVQLRKADRSTFESIWIEGSNQFKGNWLSVWWLRFAIPLYRDNEIGIKIISFDVITTLGSKTCLDRGIWPLLTFFCSQENVPTYDQTRHGIDLLMNSQHQSMLRIVLISVWGNFVQLRLWTRP